MVDSVVEINEIVVAIFVTVYIGVSPTEREQLTVILFSLDRNSGPLSFNLVHPLRSFHAGF